MKYVAAELWIVHISNGPSGPSESKRVFTCLVLVNQMAYKVFLPNKSEANPETRRILFICISFNKLITFWVDPQLGSLYSRPR